MFLGSKGSRPDQYNIETILFEEYIRVTNKFANFQTSSNFPEANMLINALACILILLVAFKWWKQHLYLARLDHIPGHSSWTRQAADEVEGN